MKMPFLLTALTLSLVSSSIEGFVTPANVSPRRATIRIRAVEIPILTAKSKSLLDTIDDAFGPSRAPGLGSCRSE
jgi:hypothetical protein